MEVECLLDDAIDGSDLHKADAAPSSPLLSFSTVCPAMFPSSLLGDWSSAVWQAGRVVSVALRLSALAATICWLAVFRWSTSMAPSVMDSTDHVGSRSQLVRSDDSTASLPLPPSCFRPPASLPSDHYSSLILALNGSTTSGLLPSHLCVDELPGRWGNHVYIIMMAVMYAECHHLTLHLPPFSTQSLLHHTDLFTSPCPTHLTNVTVQQQGEWWMAEPHTFLTQTEGESSGQPQQQSTSQPIAVHLQGYFQVSAHSHSH